MPNVGAPPLPCRPTVHVNLRLQVDMVVEARSRDGEFVYVGPTLKVGFPEYVLAYVYTSSA